MDIQLAETDSLNEVAENFCFLRQNLILIAFCLVKIRILEIGDISVNVSVNNSDIIMTMELPEVFRIPLY